MTDCNCAFERSGSVGDDEVVECDAESPNGLVCTLPAGHDGQHVACSVMEHPTGVW